MYLYTKSELSESIAAKAAAWVTSEAQREDGDISVSKKDIYERKKWHIDHNLYLLKEILEQFEWRWIRSPFADGMPISEWRHEITSDVTRSTFNGSVGQKYLSVDHARLDIYLDWYLDEEREYRQSDMLERWIVDMLIYEECRKIAIDYAGRFKFGGLASMPFFMFREKRRAREKLGELLPKAIAAYQCLDPLKVDWTHLEEALNQSYLHGVEWFHPLPNFVTRLAARQKKQVKDIRLATATD